MRTMMALVLVLSGVCAATACKSQATSICDLECDCEHCNDYENDLKCDERNAEHDVADAYGCVSKWEAWATCYEDKGSCNEKTANYSTVAQSAGSCSSTTDTMLPCPNGNSDCTTFPNATCSGGTCKYTSCSGTMQPCTTSSDCGTSGTDRCASQQKALNDCVDKASAHGGVSGQSGGSTGAGPG